jgi:hypothetical protein
VLATFEGGVAVIDRIECSPVLKILRVDESRSLEVISLDDDATGGSVGLVRARRP